jgi:hypothetical protein
MNNRMNDEARRDDVFREGDEVILAEGTYQGTRGTFLCLRADPRWADIKERNGVVREHPVEWLAHAHALPAIRLAGATGGPQS